MHTPTQDVCIFPFTEYIFNRVNGQSSFWERNGESLSCTPVQACSFCGVSSSFIQWVLAQVQKLPKDCVYIGLAAYFLNCLSLTFFDCIKWALPFWLPIYLAPKDTWVLIIISLGLCGSGFYCYHSKCAAHLWYLGTPCF